MSVSVSVRVKKTHNNTDFRIDMTPWVIRWWQLLLPLPVLAALIQPQLVLTPRFIFGLEIRFFFPSFTLRLLPDKEEPFFSDRD